MFAVCFVSVIDFLMSLALDTAHDCVVFFLLLFFVCLFVFSKYFQIPSLISM